MFEFQYQQIIERLDAIRQRLELSSFSEELLDNSDIIRYFKISKNTAAAWRRQGILPFKKIGNRIYYPASIIRRAIGLRPRKTPRAR